MPLPILTEEAKEAIALAYVDGRTSTALGRLKGQCQVTGRNDATVALTVYAGDDVGTSETFTLSLWAYKDLKAKMDARLPEELQPPHLKMKGIGKPSRRPETVQ